MRKYTPIIAAVLVLVLGVGYFASARLSNVPPSGQASDADLTTLASPSNQSFAYGSGTSAVWAGSSTIRTSNLLYSGVANSLLTQTASSGWLTQLGFGSVWPSIVALNTSSSIKTQLAADNIVTAGRSLTRTTDDIAADDELFTRTATISILNPSSTNNFTDGAIAVRFPSAATITEVGCYSLQAGTTTIQLDARAESTPGTAGTDVLSAQIACGITYASTSAFADATISANTFVNLDVDVMVGNPSSTVMFIKHTLDD